MFEFKNYILFRNLKLYSREITKPAAATQGCMLLSSSLMQNKYVLFVCFFVCLLSFAFSLNQMQGPNLFNSIFIYLVLHPWNPSKRNLKYLLQININPYFPTFYFLYLCQVLSILSLREPKLRGLHAFYQVSSPFKLFGVLLSVIYF